jgi:hypothetical protein
MQAICGAGEIEFIRHRQKVPQMPQFHRDRLDGDAANGNRLRGPVSRGASYAG